MFHIGLKKHEPVSITRRVRAISPVILAAGLLAVLLSTEAARAQGGRARGRAAHRGHYGETHLHYGASTVRSHSVVRSPYSSFSTTYFTNRAPSYRYSVGHPLSQASIYSASPYARPTGSIYLGTSRLAPPVIYHGGSTIIHGGHTHYVPPHLHVPARNYGRPGVTIGIRF